MIALLLLLLWILQQVTAEPSCSCSHHCTITIPMAETLNGLSQATASAMTTQNVINGHFKNGMALVNQCMNLLQEQLDLLREVLSVGCVHSYTRVYYWYSFS